MTELRYMHLDAGNFVLYVESVQGAAASAYDPGPDAVLVPGGVEPRPGDRWDGATLTPAPPLVVLSVLPVALRRALRATPWSGAPHALAYVQAALAHPGYEDASDAWEYAVRYYRADILALGGALGITAEMVDDVMALAAGYPGADAEYGAAV